MAMIGIQLSRHGHYHRESFRGICDFARRHHGDWRFRFLDLGQPIHDPGSLDGLIVGSKAEATSRAIHRTGLPAVNLSTESEDPHLVQIWLDDVAIGRTAAAHLHQRGFRRWAYFGFDNHLGSRRREAGFIEGLAEFGYGKDDLVVDIGNWQDAATQPATVARLGEALHSDPRPIGCFTFDDDLGAALLQQCADAGIEVPRRMGLIGAGNDDYACETSFPTMSSIDIGHRARGFQAARALAAMLRGEPVPTPLPPLPPRGLVVRQSTGPATTNDPLVDKAVAFIHTHARRDIRVADVLDHVNTSRRTLERRFHETLHWSPHQHIVYAKIEEVKQLLLTTDMDSEAIAEASGFNQRAHLSKVFRKVTGLTMMQFRGLPRRSSQ